MLDTIKKSHEKGTKWRVRSMIGKLIEQSSFTTSLIVAVDEPSNLRVHQPYRHQYQPDCTRSVRCQLRWYVGAGPRLLHHARLYELFATAWDGYQGQRQRILNRAYDDEWRNLVIVTGDTHSSWLHEIERGNVLAGSTNVSDTLAHALDASPGYKRGRIVEFGGTAVSSNGWGATWKNSANATERAAKQLVQNSGSLLYSEGFCE
jgi:hypothetical protein